MRLRRFGSEAPARRRRSPSNAPRAAGGLRSERVIRPMRAASGPCCSASRRRARSKRRPRSRRTIPSLGVEDLATPGATGTGVELGGPAEPVSLIVGKSPGARSSYVRRKGEAASWQIGTALTVERDPAKWLATDLLDIGADRIQSAEFTTDGKHRWTAEKASRADQSFRITGKSASGSASNPDSSTDRVATALAGLRLVDVRPAKDAAKDKPAATATYRTFDGLVLAIEGYAEGDKRYVRVKSIGG